MLQYFDKALIFAGLTHKVYGLIFTGSQASTGKGREASAGEVSVSNSTVTVLCTN